MEKKLEKNKKEVKETKKIIEKKIVMTDNEIVGKDVKAIIKLICYITTFFASILAIVVFVFGIIATISVSNSSSSEILHNNFVITFVSKISNTTIEETQLSILTLDNRFVYVMFNIVLPSIALVCVALLLILLSFQVLKFFSGKITEKKLFTSNRLRQLENIVNITAIIVFIVWILFDTPSLPLILLIDILLCVTYYLFKKCVQYNKQ